MSDELESSNSGASRVKQNDVLKESIPSELEQPLTTVNGRIFLVEKSQADQHQQRQDVKVPFAQEMGSD